MALPIENARPEDREAVIALLQRAELLTDDLPPDLAGFQRVDRQDVPEAIQQTQQFSDLCPTSAIMMKRTINDNAA